jgi:predicted nucleic acid-binding protein
VGAVRRIYWDTMVHAYWLESHPDFGQRVDEIYEAMLRRGDIVCSSLFALSELLVRPTKRQDARAIDMIEDYFFSDEVMLLSYPEKAVRANHGVKPLDALHLAIAAHAGVDLFLTNDHRLQKLVVAGLPFIASLDTDLFPSA